MFGEHRQLATTHSVIHHDEFSVWHLTPACQEFTMIVHAEFKTSYGGPSQSQWLDGPPVFDTTPTVDALSRRPTRRAGNDPRPVGVACFRSRCRTSR